MCVQRRAVRNVLHTSSFVLVDFTRAEHPHRKPHSSNQALRCTFTLSPDCTPAGKAARGLYPRTSDGRPAQLLSLWQTGKKALPTTPNTLLRAVQHRGVVKPTVDTVGTSQW